MPYQQRHASRDGTTEQDQKSNSVTNSEGESRTNSGVSTPNKYSNDNYESPDQYSKYNNDYRNSNSRGGSYRGNYRGGYRGRGNSYSSPYSRDSSSQSYQHSNSRQGSYTDLKPANAPYYHSRNSESSTTTSKPLQVTQTQEPVKLFRSPWVKLLSLDTLKTSDKSLESELTKIRDEKELIFEKSLKNQEKLKELKLKNLKLDFEIDSLKTTIARDQLNIDITQEKLDAISLI